MEIKALLFGRNQDLSKVTDNDATASIVAEVMLVKTESREMMDNPDNFDKSVIRFSVMPSAK